MNPNDSCQRLEVEGDRWDGRSNSQHDQKTPDHRDFDSSRSTFVQSPEHVDHPKLLGRKPRLFVAWTIKLHNVNQLRVEGTLECGRQARTKPIVRRMNSLQVLSQSNHIYHLVGNISDSEYELPGFVRHRFHAGFPEDWEIVIGIWKSFVVSQCHVAGRPSFTSEGVVVQENMKLATIKPLENDYLSECAHSVTRKQSQSHSTDESMKKNSTNGEDNIARSCDTKMIKSVIDHKSQGPQRFETMGESRRLRAWTPFILPDASVDCCLAFRGTLLSSMGFPVNKNHQTDAVRRRISARIIETVNGELYELNGDLNNTKRDVPKELVAWCRHGCPKDIDSFCEKWRILGSDENTYPRVSVYGEKRRGRNHDRGVAISSLYDMLENNERKRISTELNDSCNVIGNSINDDTSCKEQPDAKLIHNSPVRRRPKMRRKMLTNLPTTFRDDEDVAEVGHATKIRRSSHENEEQRCSPQQATTLSYTHQKCSPDTESILSDGV